MLNQAAGGNRVLADGLGPNAFSRIDRDVFSQPGVKYMMIFEGVNDIGTAATDETSQQLVGDRLIGAFRQIVVKAHALGFVSYIFFSLIYPPTFSCFSVTIMEMQCCNGSGELHRILWSLSCFLACHRVHRYSFLCSRKYYRAAVFGSRERKDEAESQ